MTDTFAEVRSVAARKFELHHYAWAQGAQMNVFPMAFAINGFTGREMLAAEEGTVTDARKWAAYDGPGTVDMARKRWPGYGVLLVPRRIVFDTPKDLAMFVRQDTKWCTVSQRTIELETDWPSIQPLGRGMVSKLTALTDSDWKRLLDALHWADTADTAEMLPRQLPVPGVDTKWVDRFWPLVEKLAAVGARTSDIPMEKLRSIEMMTTVGFLDTALRAAVGGLRVFAAQPTELADVPIAPDTVIICENLQNIHAFTDIPGTVVLAGKGFDIPAHIRIEWVHTARVLYWGDLDTHGFAMLHRLREYLPGAESILMDDTTLRANKDAWVQEATQTRAVLSKLSDDEQSVYQALIRGDHGYRVRFEQERVPWPAVVHALRKAGLFPRPATLPD